MLNKISAAEKKQATIFGSILLNSLNLGIEVFRLEKNQVPTEEQIKLLQPGDIVGRSGHFGIIAELNGEPYYFESGGWVVPKNDGVPVKAFDALKNICIIRCNYE